MKPNIVSVVYQSENDPEEFGSRAYSYYTEISLEVGDLVYVPVKDTTKVAKVVEINISESKIDERYTLKTIKMKYDDLESADTEEAK